ncbi:MAG: GNAT family protein [Pseudomonadota bacterium]
MIPAHLETERLTLRPFRDNDANAVFDYWRSDPGWERHNASVPHDFSLGDAKDFVARMCARDRAKQPHWALIHNGVVSGVVSLSFEQDHGIAVIGYGVHGNIRGRGLTAEAASTVIAAAFTHIAQLQRVRAHTSADNLPSMRVLEKLGFSHEGTLRKNVLVKGAFVDDVVYGLLRHEWRHR